MYFDIILDIIPVPSFLITTINWEKKMKTPNVKALVASAVLVSVTATSALAADITMNLGFGAPEESLYGRFGKIFEAKALCRV